MVTIRTEYPARERLSTLVVCGGECPATQIVTNADGMSHFVSNVISFSDSVSYPLDRNTPSRETLAAEWEELHKADPTSRRALSSGAAVCAACEFKCAYQVDLSGRTTEKMVLPKIGTLST